MNDSVVFRDNITSNTYVGVVLNAFGNNITNLKIGNYDLNNSDFIKYFEMKYYDNDTINMAYFWNPITKDITLSGKLIFNGSGGVLIVNNDILNENESVISFGGELPSQRNEYTLFVNSNKNSINNGLKQQKINYKMNLANGILGGIGKGAAVGLGSAAASGGISIASTVVGAVSGAASVATGIAGTVMNNKAYYDGLRAKHADLQATKGMVFSTSDVESMTNNITNTLDVLGELTKITIPSIGTLSMMNKMNELYGYLNPQILNIHLLSGLGYYALDINYFSEWLDTNHITTRSVKDAILKRVELGFRLI